MNLKLMYSLSEYFVMQHVFSVQVLPLIYALNTFIREFFYKVTLLMFYLS